MGLRQAMAALWSSDEAPARAAASSDIQETRWRGASRMLRSLQSWVPWLGSPTSDLPAHEQRTLRARSRSAFRDSPLGRAALTRSRTNIVGTGLMCRPSVDFEALGITAEAAETLNNQLRRRWEQWAEDPAECDWEATFDFYGLQGLALLSAMASGDVFALTPQTRRIGGTAELKVQLVEADRISNPNDGVDTATRVDGVELLDGAPIGYWVRNTHPGDKFNATIPVWSYYAAFGDHTGRRRVMHVWNDKERPGQVRGAPYLAPVLEPLKQIERYSGAELMAAVISAMLTVFIKKSADVYDEQGNPAEVLADSASANGQSAAAAVDNTIALGNGAVVDLAVGEEPVTVNPARPNANFDPFFTAIVTQIGATLELPVDELLLRYQASYSAARAAMLQAWRFYILRRWALTQQFCQPVYGLLIDEDVAAGRIRLPGYADPIKRRAYTRALWIGPARGSMDEEKEARAAKLRIDAGVSNEAIETAAMVGEDRGDVYAQRLREINQRKRDGTWFPPSGTSAPPAPDDSAQQTGGNQP